MFHNYLHHQGNRRIYKKPNCLYSLPQMSVVYRQRCLEEWEQKSSNTKSQNPPHIETSIKKCHNPTSTSQKSKLDFEWLPGRFASCCHFLQWYELLFFHIKTLWRTPNFLIIILLRYEHSHNSIYQFMCTCRSGLMRFHDAKGWILAQINYKQGSLDI